MARTLTVSTIFRILPVINPTTSRSRRERGTEVAFGAPDRRIPSRGPFRMLSLNSVPLSTDYLIFSFSFVADFPVRKKVDVRKISKVSDGIVSSSLSAIHMQDEHENS